MSRSEWWVPGVPVILVVVSTLLAIVADLGAGLGWFNWWANTAMVAAYAALVVGFAVAVLWHEWRRRRSDRAWLARWGKARRE